MKYFVAWDMRFKTPKHFGTLIIADDYLVLLDNKRTYEDGMIFTTPYEIRDGKMKVIEGGRSLVKIPNGKIEFEVLSEEEFDEKYVEGLCMTYKETANE